MKKNQEQVWAIGDLFLVQTGDGMNVIGQVVAREPEVLNSVTCAFFDLRVKSASDVHAIAELPVEQIFSILFVTRDSLDCGRWRVVGNRPVTVSQNLLPFEAQRKNGYVGARVIGSGNVTEFLDAFYGLVPWDGWKDPGYLDKLLLSPEKKPHKLMLRHA